MYISEISGLKSFINSAEEIERVKVDQAEWSDIAIDLILRYSKRYDISIQYEGSINSIKKDRINIKNSKIELVEKMADEIPTKSVNSILIKGSLSYKNNYHPGWSDVDLVFVTDTDASFVDILNSGDYDACLAEGNRINSVNFLSEKQISMTKNGRTNCRPLYDLLQIRKFAVPVFGDNPFQDINPKASGFDELYTEIKNRHHSIRKMSQMLVDSDSDPVEVVQKILKGVFIMTKRSINLHRPELVLEYYKNISDNYDDIGLPDHEKLLNLIFFKETITYWEESKIREIGKYTLKFAEILHSHILNNFDVLKREYTIPMGYKYSSYLPPQERMQY